jgi:hypothetical protein
MLVTVQPRASKRPRAVAASPVTVVLFSTTSGSFATAGVDEDLVGTARLVVFAGFVGARLAPADDDDGGDDGEDGLVGADAMSVTRPAAVPRPFGLRTAMTAMTSTATPTRPIAIPAHRSRRFLPASWRVRRPFVVARPRCRAAGPSAGADGWRATSAAA